MAGDNWFEDLLTKIIGESGTDVLSDVWTDTVSPILSPPPERTFGLPQDSPFVQGLNQFRESGNMMVPADLAAFIGNPALGLFKMGADIAAPAFRSPPTNVSDVYVGLEDKLDRPPMPTGITPIIIPPDGVPGVASKGIPPPPTIGGAAATAAAHQAPSLADLYANRDQLARDAALDKFTAAREHLTSVEAAWETKLAELARLQRSGATGAATAVREALATLEATRFARLRNDEAEAKAHLATLEQRRVDREDELSDDVKARSDEALANYDSIVSGVEGSLGGLSGPPAQSIFGDATRERGLLTSQALSQQDLLSTLAGTYANDAVDRGMRLGATYDQAGLDLSDRLWQQNTANDLALQQALSNIDIAGAQQDIDLYSQMAPMRFANEQEYNAALADIEAGAAARGIAGAEQAQLLDALGPLLGGVPGSAGFDIANAYGTEGLGQIFGAASQAGVGSGAFDLLTDAGDSGKITVPIGGQELTVDQEWYAAQLLKMLEAQSAQTRTIDVGGEQITLPVEDWADMLASQKVGALG